ncbi:hypothetical protein ACWCXK_38965 [Streptomyces sp. NPDC001739]
MPPPAGSSEARRRPLGEHLHEAATLAGVAGTNAADLRQAINDETYEHRVKYRSFATRARQDGDTKATELFTEIAAEGIRRHAFRRALAVVRSGHCTSGLHEHFADGALTAGWCAPRRGI